MRNKQTTKWRSNIQMDEQKGSPLNQQLRWPNRKSGRSFLNRTIDFSGPQIIIESAMVKKQQQSSNRSYPTKNWQSQSGKQWDMKAKHIENQKNSFSKERSISENEGFKKTDISIVYDFSVNGAKNTKKKRRNCVHPSMHKIVKDLKKIIQQLKAILKGYQSKVQSFISSFKKQLALKSNKLLIVPQFVIPRKTWSIKSRISKLNFCFQVFDQVVTGTSTSASNPYQYSSKNSFQQNHFNVNLKNQLESFRLVQSPIYNKNENKQFFSFCPKSVVEDNQVTEEIGKVQKNKDQQQLLPKKNQKDIIKQRKPGGIINIRKSSKNVSRYSLTKAELLDRQLQHVTDLLNKIDDIIS